MVAGTSLVPSAACQGRWIMPTLASSNLPVAQSTWVIEVHRYIAPSLSSQSRSCTASKRSFGRPLANLFRSNNCGEITGTESSSNCMKMQFISTSSNVTPSIRVKMSIRMGLRPSMRTFPSTSNGFDSSGNVLPNPNSVSARRSRFSLSSVIATMKSISPVARGFR